MGRRWQGCLRAACGGHSGERPLASPATKTADMHVARAHRQRLGVRQTARYGGLDDVHEGGGVGHDLAIVPHGTIACGRLSKAISSATGVRDPLACSRFVVWDDFLNAASEAHASRTRLE